MKRFIVEFLEDLCTFVDDFVIDYLPERLQDRWYCKPAELSARLDEKWKTGRWHD
jgi:hypothetical protein